MRGASTTAALNKGVSVADISHTADWSSDTTFRRFYYCPSGNNYSHKLLKRDQKDIGKSMIECLCGILQNWLLCLHNWPLYLHILGLCACIPGVCACLPGLYACLADLCGCIPSLCACILGLCACIPDLYACLPDLCGCIPSLCAYIPGLCACVPEPGLCTCTCAYTFICGIHYQLENPVDLCCLQVVA